MTTQLAKAKQIQVEASSATGAGTLQELIEAKEIYRETDITVTQGENSITIESSTGSSGAITAATNTSSGVMSKDDKVKLNALPDSTSLTSALATKVDKETGKGLIDPAPVDGKQYSRKDDAWVEVTGDVEEAPIDGKQYARKDASWEEVVASGGGGGDVEEAPTDGKLYGRKESGWTEIVVESGMLSLSFDQEVLALAGRDFPLIDDFPDPTKNYKGLIYDSLNNIQFPYTATYLPNYFGVENVLEVEIFPDPNVPFHFKYMTLVFGGEVAVMPTAATPFYSVRTSTGLPSGVNSLDINYQLEGMRDLSIAGISVELSAGNKDIPISIDLDSLTAEYSSLYGMPMEFYPMPFEPSFSDPLGHGIMRLGVAGVTDRGTGFKAHKEYNGDLVITSDNDLAHYLSIKIPVTKRGF